MSSRTIRFGVIGVGQRGQNLDGLPVYNGIAEWHAKYINERPDARVVACASRTAANVQWFAEEFDLGDGWYTDYREMLERDDIDAVTITTASGAHGDAIIAAAEAGKHVLVEKPLEITVEKVDAAIAACRRHKVKLGVVFPMRFRNTSVALKQAIADGRMGKVLVANAICRRYRDDAYYQGSRWRGTWELDGGGACMNQGIHVIDLYQHLCGPIESITAHTATLGHAGIEVEDAGVAVVRFKEGGLGVIECTTCAYPDFQESLHIHAEKGSYCSEAGKVRWDMMESDFEFVAADYAEDPVPYTCHRKVIADFVSAIEQDRDPLCSGEEGRKAVELIRGLYESAQTGKPVFF